MLRLGKTARFWYTALSHTEPAPARLRICKLGGGEPLGGIVFLGVALLICGLAVALNQTFYIALR